MADRTVLTSQLPPLKKYELIGRVKAQTDGYHVYYLPEVKRYPKGSVLYVHLPDTAKIAVSTQSIGLYNDYDWNEQKLLDRTKRMSLVVNLVLESETLSATMVSSQTRIRNTITHSFVASRPYKITASFQCDGQLYSHQLTNMITGMNKQALQSSSQFCWLIVLFL